MQWIWGNRCIKKSLWNFKCPLRISHCCFALVVFSISKRRMSSSAELQMVSLYIFPCMVWPNLRAQDRLFLRQRAFQHGGPRQVWGVTLWNVAPPQEPVWSVQHWEGFLPRVLSSAHGIAKGVDAGASKASSTRVTCAHRATELGRRWGWLESFSRPHSPVRHGSERTSCAAPDSDDWITLHSAGIFPFFNPPSMASNEFSTGKS